jgi:putative ABC transport system ATP-binding protein
MPAREPGARRVRVHVPDSSGHSGGAAISIRHLTHMYRVGGQDVPALSEIDLDVQAGEFLAIAGPSGAGKTTLLSLIGGLQRPTCGEVLVDEVDVCQLRRDDLAAYRREVIGFVFQHYGLVPVLTACENIELALAIGGLRRLERRERCRLLLDAVGLTRRADHRPAELSGGERQRVAIARAIANGPKVLVADEPTGNLDGRTSQAIIELLERVRVTTGCTLVVVSHHPDVLSGSTVSRRLENGRWVT